MMGGCPYAAETIIPEKSWLFKFPAICLGLGVFGIWAFIKRTVNKIAAKKAEDAAKRAAEVKTK